MKIDILTVFPEQIEQFCNYGVIRIARKLGVLQLKAHDLRKWTHNKHKSVDDRPYGGGAGMLLKIEPIDEALQELRTEESVVIATTPVGQKLDQKLLKKLAVPDDHDNKHYILLCGHYEGFDQRILDNLVDMEISIGDFVLSGGELPALSVVDGISRLLPGVLGNSDSVREESFEDNLLEYPHYTRPPLYKEWSVPEILLSGNHAEIDKWRKSLSKGKTSARRPDLNGGDR